MAPMPRTLVQTISAHMPAEMMQSEYDRIHNPRSARTCIVPAAQCIVTISGQPTQFGNCQLGKWIVSTRSRGTLAEGMPLINPHAWRVHSSPAFSFLRDLTKRKHTLNYRDICQGLR